LFALVCSVTTRHPPGSSLFPYTSLFRSRRRLRRGRRRGQGAGLPGRGRGLPQGRHPDPGPGRGASGSCVPLPERIVRPRPGSPRSEEHTSELQSLTNLVCRLLLAKKNKLSEASGPHYSTTSTEVTGGTGDNPAYGY